MKIKTGIVICAFGLSTALLAQDYRDKGAEEKAAQEKEAMLKEMQVKQAQPQPYEKQYDKQNRAVERAIEAEHPKNQQYDKPNRTSQEHAGQFIPCPVTQIETRVTSAIPSDWWDTPQVGNLQNTQVTEIGGIPTLQCLYWGYGREIPIMKRVPDGMNCVAQSNGFNCQ